MKRSVKALVNLDVANTSQFVGRETLDFIALGFTNLLRWGIQVAKSLKKPLVTG